MIDCRHLLQKEGQNAFFADDIQSVTNALSRLVKFDHTDLIFVDPGVKVSETHYHETHTMLLSLSTLAVRSLTSSSFSRTVLQRIGHAKGRALILFIQTLALYKSFTYLLTEICDITFLKVV